MVSCPLLTPLTFLWTRLPSVARLNARGPQGRSVLQGTPLDRSGAFRSGTLPPCTVWPRTVMRGKSRKLTSGHNSVPKSARRTEPSPRNPRFAARPKGVAAQRRVWGSQEGAREPYGALAPFCLRRQTAAMHAQCHGEHPPAREGLSRLQRRTAVSAENFTSAFGEAERVLIACGGKPPERRNRLPSADGIASKKRAFRLSLELEYDAREGAHADEHDRMHLRQLPDRDRNH